MDKAAKKLIEYRVESARGSGKRAKLAEQLIAIFNARLNGTYIVRVETRQRTAYAKSCERVGPETLELVTLDDERYDVDLINIRSFRFYENLEA